VNIVVDTLTVVLQTRYEHHAIGYHPSFVLLITVRTWWW
jgi:hypothetical protein